MGNIKVEGVEQPEDQRQDCIYLSQLSKFDNSLLERIFKISLFRVYSSVIQNIYSVCFFALFFFLIHLLSYLIMKKN